MHIHFIGICGTFMSGLARLAQSLGHHVTGSDREFYPPMSDQLKAMGITTYQGFDASVWEDITPDLVIVGNVCTRGMPIIESLLRKGIPYTHGPAWLKDTLLTHRHVFVVAGTHGKTTTTAMLVHILRQQGIDTGYLIGGVVPALEGSAALGDSDYFVIEGDEYDCAYFDKRPKFMHYQPDTFVIGNVEYDHADIYEHVQQIEQQFHYGVRLVPPSGTVIFGRGEHVQNVRQKGIWSNCIDLNDGGYRLRDNAIVVRDTEANAGEGAPIPLPEHLIGTHNQTNALVASLAAQSAGVSLAQSMQALRSFQGVKRRLERIGDINDILVFDDFAHHPTAVDLTLSAMRAHFPNRRLISILEPRSNTMKMGAHADKLPKALAQSDKSFVYLPRDSAWTIDGDSQVFHDVDAFIHALLPDLHRGDAVVIMSNGSFNGLHHKLLTALRAKYGES